MARGFGWGAGEARPLAKRSEADGHKRTGEHGFTQNGKVIFKFRIFYQSILLHYCIKATSFTPKTLANFCLVFFGYTAFFLSHFL